MRCKQPKLSVQKQYKHFFCSKNSA